NRLAFQYATRSAARAGSNTLGTEASTRPMMNASSAQTLLKDAISELKTIEFSHTPPNEAAISRLKLPSFDNPIDKSKPLDLDKIAKEIVEIFAKGGIPERRDVRHAAFCI